MQSGIVYLDTGGFLWNRRMYQRMSRRSNDQTCKRESLGREVEVEIRRDRVNPPQCRSRCFDHRNAESGRYARMFDRVTVQQTRAPDGVQMQTGSVYPDFLQARTTAARMVWLYGCGAIHFPRACNRRVPPRITHHRSRFVRVKPASESVSKLYRVSTSCILHV